MIEFLRGTLLSIEGEHILLEVGGVGYGLDLPSPTAKSLPEPGADLELHVSMIVREDAMTLFGFSSREERTVFEIFRNISGIGPRTALDIISTVSIDEVTTAVRAKRPEALERVPGIGRKKAERLILELKDRLDKFPSSASGAKAGLGGGENREPGGSTGVSSEEQLYQDAVAALRELGTKPAQASRKVTSALRHFDGAEPPNLSELVRKALQV